MIDRFGAWTRSRLGTAAAVAFAVAVGGCGHGGKFIWVDQVPKTMATQQISTAVTAGDVISIRVWNQEANSIEKVKVRDDGRISMPFLNDVEVAGVEPQDLARRLEVKLKSFIVNPLVTVVIHERRALRVAVLGNVTRPGLYELEPRAGVLASLAAAGGVTPFASRDRIFVIRNGYWADGDPAPGRIRFRYDDLVHAEAAAANFQLRPGDTVVVE